MPRSFPAGTASGPGLSSASLALRRWWVLVLVLAALGAALGYRAGQGAPATSQVLLRVGVIGTDSSLVTQAVQTAVLLSDSPETYARAAAGLGSEGRSLASRTVIASVPDTQVFSVTVTAPNGPQATADASAVAAAAVELSAQRSAAVFAVIRSRGNELLATGTLSDPNAERARRSQVGASVAQSQSDALSASEQLTVLSSQPVSGGVIGSPAVVAALGLLAGALVGAALALGLGSRRGRVRNLQELQLGYPDVEAMPLTALPAVLADTADRGDSLVLLVGPGNERVSGAVVDAAESALVDSGRRVLRVNIADAPEEGEVSTSTALARAPREQLLSEHGCDVVLLTGGFDNDLVHRVAAQSVASVVVAVRLRRSRHRRLGQLVTLGRHERITLVAVP